MPLTRITNDALDSSAFSANTNFDSGTLFVDAVNNRVGIGNTAPGETLTLQTPAGNNCIISTYSTGLTTCQLKLGTDSKTWVLNTWGSSHGGTNPGGFSIGAESNGNGRFAIDSNGNVYVGGLINHFNGSWAGAAMQVANNSTVSIASTIGVGGASGSTSGAGITFPATQSASTNANTLDDYEEGTWTPTLVSGGFTSITQNKATYTKIGNRVWYTADFSLVGTGNSNQLQFGGLPFTVVTNGWSAGSCYFGSQNTDFWHVAALPYGGQSYIVIQVVTTAGAGSTMVGSNLGASYVNVSGFYEVA